MIQIPQAFHIPASGAVPYQYIAVPTNFNEDKWVQSVEIRPGNRKVVHHINLSAVPPSAGGAGRPPGFFTSDAERRMLDSMKPGQEPPQFAAGREGELLETFVPGGLPPELEPGQAKLVKSRVLAHIPASLHDDGKAGRGSNQRRLHLRQAAAARAHQIHTGVQPPLHDSRGRRQFAGRRAGRNFARREDGLNHAAHAF